MAKSWIPRALAPTFLADCRRGFEAGDVWRAWEACHVALTYRLPLPPWVLRYLGGAARALTTLSRKPNPKTDGALAVAVRGALGLTVKGRGTLQARREQSGKMAAFAVDVALLVADGHTEYLAIGYVAKFHGRSHTVVRDAYKAAKARGDRLDGRRFCTQSRGIAQELHPGSRMEGVHYTGEPRRAWIVESLTPTGDDIVEAVFRLEPIKPTTV